MEIKTIHFNEIQRLIWTLNLDCLSWSLSALFCPSIQSTIEILYSKLQLIQVTLVFCIVSIEKSAFTNYFDQFSDPNTLVESVSFASQNKLQPFMVSITTSSVLLMDFHCHLTKQEVCGYLGGSWDNNTQSKLRKFNEIEQIKKFTCSFFQHWQ